jgi:Trypsin
MPRLPFAFALVFVWCNAFAMVGGAPPASDAVARRVALIVGSRGNFCSGVALARDLVLTAAHCVVPGADYKLVEYDEQRRPILRDIAQIARHPQFELSTLLAHRATADVALLKLVRPADLVPALLAQPREPFAVGDRLLVAGYGVAVRGDGRTGGSVRIATLSVTGQPSSLQLRLFDPDAPATGGLGAAPAIPARQYLSRSSPWRLSAWSAGQRVPGWPPAAAV